MNGLASALWAEALKGRRSRLPLFTVLGSALAPLVGGLFMIILKDPKWARRSGLITAKAQITVGIADWPAYFDLLAQAIAVGGLILFGLTTIWVFGREYADRTIKDLLALPTSRTAIVVAKFIVVIVWSALLAVIIFGLGLGIGAVVGLPGWSIAVVVGAAWKLARIAALTIALALPFAWMASAGRGYLPPIAGMILVIFLAQIVAALGWGAYFPWSVPALASGVAGPGVYALTLRGYLLVGLTGSLGVASTLWWWCFAEQT